MYRSFNFTSIGASNIKKGTVCQDYSASVKTDIYKLAVVLEQLGTETGIARKEKEREKQEKVFPCGTLFLMCPKQRNFGLYFQNLENIMRKSRDVVLKTRSIPGGKY